ncbi:MAG: hypothetical protein R3C13_03865 [Hyphomonas sp.]|uniref:CC0125/CC1285 family lipoprotein n=1 Tax=Hyphomonas sp. TaxID=87 RepID=UPI003527F8AB
MPRLKIAAGLAALAMLGACATATPYQPAMTSSMGYSELKIETNRFQVQFAGNSLTDRKTVETYLLYRAAELTKLNGYDHFRVVRRDTDADSRMVAVGGAGSPFYNHFYLDYYYFSPRAPIYRSRFYDPFYDPFWGAPTEYRESTRYVATAEILMGKGEKPDDAAYFDADEVIMNLSGTIMRPDEG